MTALRKNMWFQLSCSFTPGHSATRAMVEEEEEEEENWFKTHYLL